MIFCLINSLSIYYLLINIFKKKYKSTLDIQLFMIATDDYENNTEKKINISFYNNPPKPYNETVINFKVHFGQTKSFSIPTNYYFYDEDNDIMQINDLIFEN